MGFREDREPVEKLLRAPIIPIVTGPGNCEDAYPCGYQPKEMGISVGMAEQYSEREISQLFDELITAWWGLTTTRSLLSDPPMPRVLPPGAPLEMPLGEASALMDAVPLREPVQKLEEEYAAAASRVKSILPEGSSVVHDYRSGADAERAGKYTIRHQASQLQVERTNT